MDHHQRQSDGERRKARRRLAVGGAHDDEQEHHGHHHFGDEANHHVVLPGRMRVIAVGCKALRQIEAGRAARDHIEQRCGNDRADHLRDDIRNDLLRRKPSAGREADRDGGIEMAAGDVADRIGHGYDAQSERQ